MKDQANNIVQSVLQFWKAQEKKRKIIFIASFVALIIIAVIIVAVLNKKEYTVLYSGLETTEAAAILTEIQNMEIDAKVEGDGKIMVPVDQENSLRMQLGTMGYPKSGFSYDTWTSNVDMFTTESEKREYAKMQLQERLQATIQTLAGVEQAIVNLDIPQSSNTVISNSSKEATASVVIHLKSGVALAGQQVEGIKRIVKMSISGLKDENISITDGFGNILDSKTTESTQPGDEVKTDKLRLEFKSYFESELRDACLQLLVPSYGDDGVQVAVNANFNYDKKASEDTQYTPSTDDDKGMIQHEDKKNEQGSTGADDGDVVGVEPNADGTYPTGEGDENNGSWSSSESSTTYLVNTLKTQTEKNGYEVEKVSVSVMVYKDILGDDEREVIRNTVASASGTDPEFVAVGNIPKFGTIDGGDDPTSAPITIFGLSLERAVIYAILIVLAILFFLIVMIVIRSKIAKKRHLALIEAQLEAQSSSYAPLPEEIVIESLSKDKPETKEEAVRREIGDFAQNSPDISAQLLKSWLREEK